MKITDAMRDRLREWYESIHFDGGPPPREDAIRQTQHETDRIDEEDS